MLTEAPTLAPSELTGAGHDARFPLFIKKIASGSPFTSLDGAAIVIDPTEASRLQQLFDAGQFKGGIKAKILNSPDSIPLSKLAKTKEFGGMTAAAGENPSDAGKEALKVKPSQIHICDQNIDAADFYDIIANNSILSSTDYGKVVQQFAQYIISSERVVFPDEYLEKDKEKVRNAIVDYAGEYLGVLALLYNRTVFPKRKAFLEWLGGDIGDLTLNFPLKANNNLADSFASITSDTTSHSVNISSKGNGGGAAPAISGLKISPELKENRKLKNALRFVELCQASDRTVGPSTITQAFSAVDFIFNIAPESLPKHWLKFLPLSEKYPNLVQQCVTDLANFKQGKDSILPAKFSPLFSGLNVKKRTCDAGKLIYNLKKYVAEAINEHNAIPEFQSTILQILEMNFIQQYSEFKGGELVFTTQWPAKLDGEISVVNKCSAVDPTAGGFSFKLGRVTDGDDGFGAGLDIDDIPDEETPVVKPNIMTGGRTEVGPSAEKKAAIARVKDKASSEPIAQKVGRGTR